MAGAVSFAEPEPAYFGPRLITESVRLPSADGRYSIYTTIVRPEGPGPYGAVILNHGVPGPSERASVSASDFASVAPVFARRGYAVIMPIRRGFGRTGGDVAEDAGPCSNPNYLRAESNAADDVMIAYDYAQRLSYVDPSRMILAGQSAGGMVSVFTAGQRQPRGLVAVLAFAAGRGGNPDFSPGIPCAEEPVARVFDRIGRTVQAPVMFHYSENDHYFAPKVTKAWYTRFTEAGAKAEYVLQPPFKDDGHFIFGNLIGVEYWLPAVEKFLDENKVAFRRLDLEDPKSRPLLTAKLPSNQTPTCGGLYRVFLESPAPRAYAVSNDGHCGFASGSSDVQRIAMRGCASMTASPCALYAVDTQIVWKDPEPDAPTAVALTPASSNIGK